MPTEPSVDPSSVAPFLSLTDLLERQSRRIPNAPAILAPGRPALTYLRLSQHIDATRRTLRAMGIGRRDRIAVVLPNGPELAVAALAVATSAVCTPLNPAYGAEELDRYFSHLRTDALITQAGFDSPARGVALARGVRIIELSLAHDAQAGLFTFAEDDAAASSDESVDPGDVALLVLTSGTTSRPKVVPQTHAKLCAAAYNWAAAMALNETDRCLSVMPLFHGHGLTATVLASLAAGASIVCAPRLDVERFFAWLIAFRPTWYTAVPTLHQAILAAAPQHREQIAACRLRFIRAASAPLPPRVFAELETTFDTPVINCYAMTETAAGPVTCNPLPPRRRKAGSVGVPAGLDVAIMDGAGALLPRGETGQIVVSGASVISGYDGDKIASQAAFAGGWFKTGDLGFFDDDGYLFLVGRSREIINRGGEKIVPQEVDDVLLDHPTVAEAVTFAVPHSTLGEDVAAAVVLRPGATAEPQDIRQFAAARLAGFKVPRQVLIFGELPKGPTGKIQRVNLAATLGLARRTERPQTFVAPRTPIEEMLADCLAQVLRVEQVGIHDDFFELGGDSLSVTQVLALLYEMIHIEIEVSRLFDMPTVAELAQYLESLIPSGQARTSSAIVRTPRQDGVPSSIAQQRLWILQGLLPSMPFFNILYALRLTSAIDAAVLERSLNEIVRRHDILRTTFAVIDGRFLQVIAPQLVVRLRFDDLRALPDSERDTIGRRAIEEDVLYSFDLAQGPLFRARLVRLAEREHLLLISMHQTIGDGWSAGVIADELVALYDAFSIEQASPLAPLPIQYADFAYWQRNWPSHPDMVLQLDYWRGQLRDPLPVIRLAAGSRRTIDGLLTARRDLALPAELSRAAKRFGNREGGTLFMVLVAALKTLLHGYLGQQDMRLATLVANRNRPGAERLIGPLANTVILRTDLGGDPSARELLRRVRATTLAAFANQELPFEVLAETLTRERGLEPAALAPVMIHVQTSSLRPTQSAGRRLVFEEANPSMPVPVITATEFDLILMLHEITQGLAGSCVYKPHLFDADAIDRLLADFRSVLDQMVTWPERTLSAICFALDQKQSIPPLRA